MTELVSAVARRTEPRREGTPRVSLDRADGELSAAAARLLAADRPAGSGFQSAI